MKGILIIGHGSRDLEAQKQFLEVVQMIGDSMDCKVIGAFMELAKPDFHSVVEVFVKDGIDHITVCPLFLFAGVHIKKDIPELIEEAKAKFPDVRFTFEEPIGPSKDLADIIVRKLK